MAFLVCVGMSIAPAEVPASAPVAAPGVEERSETDAQASAHATQTLEGWTLYIHQTLLSEHPAETAKAVELLRGQLAKIRESVPAEAVEHLRKIPLWFNPHLAQMGPPGAAYHPDAGWLRRNGYNPAMAKCVEFTNIAIFERECRRMPMLALHELAHAFHHQVLGYDHPEIIAAYERAVKSGRYDDVERWSGEHKFRDRAYALNNPMEYFAETSEAFFGRNDFQPFDHEELQRMDPEMCTLLERLWKVKVSPKTVFGEAPGQAEPSSK